MPEVEQRREQLPSFSSTSYQKGRESGPFILCALRAQLKSKSY